MRVSPGYRLVRALLAPVLLSACVGSATDPAPVAAPARASPAFWKHWGDGRAELDAYAVRTPRYGSLRDAEAVLIYVTEPMDSRTWIKDDRGDVPERHRVQVLKLNHVLKFRTGIYPYSVMTSVFAPVDGGLPERFSPVKISFTAQEWCGHVFQTIRPVTNGFRSEIRSYFATEGDRTDAAKTPAGTLYEDALWIQLRELDGPFHSGQDWSGFVVPGLWSLRKGHARPAPVPASIRRTEAERGGVPVTRFVLESGSVRRTFDVEKEAPRRILGWTGPDGEEGKLLGTDRLPYWELNRPGDESHLSRIGLVPGVR